MPRREGEICLTVNGRSSALAALFEEQREEELMRGFVAAEKRVRAVLRSSAVILLIAIQTAAGAQDKHAGTGQTQREAVVNESLYFSPYNTYSDGRGPMLSNNVHQGSSYAMWINPGAYLKATFTGTAATLDIEVTGDATEQPAKVRWSVDDAPWTTGLLAFGIHAVTLASASAKGRHSLEFIYAASDANVSRWREPLMALKVHGIELDADGALERPTGSVTPFRKNVIFFGDSITEGAWVTGNSNRRVSGQYVDWVSYSDATLAWPRAVAAALRAEFGVCAFGGTGWVTSPHPYVPPLPDSWSLYFEGHSRLQGGKLDPPPDYVIVNMGTNDPDHTRSEVIESWLRQARASVGPRASILLIVPFAGRNGDEIGKALQSVNDPHSYKVDLGMQWTYGIGNYGHPSMRSMDGLHPSAAATAEYAAAVAAAIARTVDH